MAIEKVICKGKVWNNSRSYGCDYKAWQDGFCKIHHPRLIKEKEQKRQDKWKRQREENEKRRADHKFARQSKTANDIIEFFDTVIFPEGNDNLIEGSPQRKGTEASIISILNR